MDIIGLYSRAREHFNCAEKHVVDLASDNFFQDQYMIKILGIKYVPTRNVSEKNIYIYSDI